MPAAALVLADEGLYEVIVNVGLPQDGARGTGINAARVGHHHTVRIVGPLVGGVPALLPLERIPLIPRELTQRVGGNHPVLPP